MHTIQREIKHYIDWCNKHNKKYNNAYSLRTYFIETGGISNVKCEGTSLCN